ncbi:hypothetical protein PUN28_004579 [Cardiocondyla obscurior]|uniref:Uncharacterized protein n=1 Tax=Cardiocondyla obscurior TaxID=286306 RepID=A0AAW2GGI3_9HYME
MKTKEERGIRREKKTTMTAMMRGDASWRVNEGVSLVGLYPGFLVRIHTTTRVLVGIRRGQHCWRTLEASRVPIFGSVAYRSVDVISGVATPASLSRSSAARRFTTHPYEKLK